MLRVGILKPCTDVVSNLLVIDLGWNVRIACDGLQQKFQHAEYFTCDPLISQSILIQFQTVFTVIIKISSAFQSYNMVRRTSLFAIASK